MEKDYHEDTDQVGGANVYNGQLSTLWVNFRQAFPDKIQETYQDLRSNSVLNYDELVDQFITKGSDKWSESIYNEDGDFKYVSMLRSSNDATNLPQIRGTGEEHFRYFIENRLNYCDSKWYAGEYISRPNPNNSGENIDNFAVLRIYTPVDENGNPRTDLAVPASADITLTMYSHMYAGVRYKANGTLMQKRLSANETYTFDAPNEIFNDTETAIYGAPHLSSLGDLAPLYLGYIDVGAATKLVELKIGDSTPGYQNNNLYHLALGTNRLLKKIDIQNCIGFDQALDLTGCPNIEEVYAKGSGITGVDLPGSGYLKVLQLPATIANLTLKNQLYIEDFEIEGYNNLKTMECDNCPSIDTLTILDNAPNIERVRLTKVDWEWDDASILFDLIERNIAGKDEHGNNTSTMWIDGKCHIKELTGQEYAEIRRLYPYLEITYTTLTSNLIFMSDDGETEFCRQTIINGANGTDPVGAGTIPTPTKESTAQYHFTYSGWSLTSGGDADANALIKVEGDRIVYAAYHKAIRSYTVNFYNGSTLLETYVIEYGNDAKYNGATPVKEGYTTEDFEFIGWKPAPLNIQGNTDCYAQYYDLQEIDASWSTIYADCLSGRESNYEIGSFKPVAIGTTDLPYDFYSGDAVVYNDEIHIFGGGGNNVASNTYHYKWDGTEWLEASTLPYKFHYASAVVYNNEIHIIGSNVNGVRKKHYKYDGTTWTEVSTLPYDFYEGAAVVYNDEIHIIGGGGNRTAHYKLDGTGWTSVSTLLEAAIKPAAVIFNEKIIMSSNAKMYEFDGSKWSLIDSTFSSYMPYGPSDIAIYNGEIYLFGGTYYNYGKPCIKYTGNGYTACENIPFSFCYGVSIVYNDEIYLLGTQHDYMRSFVKYTADSGWSYIGDYETIDFEVAAHNHDELSGATWRRIYVGNTGFGGLGVTLAYDGKIHYIRGTIHKTYDGTKIESLSALPFSAGNVECRGVVWNNEIHIVGAPGGANATSQYHYKYDGTSWTSACEPSYSGNTTGNLASGYGATLAVYNDEMYRTVGIGQNNMLYKFDGTSWIEVVECPVNMYHGAMVSYDGALHVLNGTYHFKWDGSTWTQVSTLPYNFSMGSAVEYCGKIHLFGCHSGTGYERYHYEWDGIEWTRLDDLIDTHGYTTSTTAFVYNNELYLGGNDISERNGQYVTVKWCEPGWEEETMGYTLGYTSPDVIYQNNYYGFYNDGWYKYDGNTWAKMEVNVPYSIAGGVAIVYNDEIHVLGGSTDTNHYKWNGTEWVSVSTLPCAVSTNVGTAVVYNDEIHVLSAKKHYKWNGTEWVEVDTIPELVQYNTKAVVYNNEIHIPVFQSKDVHYKWNPTDGWVHVGSIGFGNLTECGLVTFNDELHLIGGYSYSASSAIDIHYKFNGVEWVKVSTLPYTLRYCHAQVFRGHICCFGGFHHQKNMITYRNPRSPLTFIARNVLSEPVKYHNTANAGIGWKDSDSRTQCNNEIFNNLPKDLRDAIGESLKVSDTGFNGKSLENVNDKIWIPSVEELGFDQDENIVLGQGSPYPIFTDDSSRIREGSGFYWTRTANVLNSNSQFMTYCGSGVLDTAVATNGVNSRILPGFCI